MCVSVCVCERERGSVCVCVCVCCTHNIRFSFTIYMLSVADLQTINTWHQEDTSKMWAYGPFKNQTRCKGRGRAAAFARLFSLYR